MKERKRKPLVKYDPLSDVLYIATREGVEEEFTEVAPGLNPLSNASIRGTRLQLG